MKTVPEPQATVMSEGVGPLPLLPYARIEPGTSSSGTVSIRGFFNLESLDAEGLIHVIAGASQ